MGINDTAGLFWCHIANCATDCDGSTNAGAWFQRAGDTKIGNHQTTIFLMKQDVLWLDVAMNNWARTRVSIVQCVNKLVKIMDCLVNGERAICLRKPMT